jgi:hypothetical protein
MKLLSLGSALEERKWGVLAGTCRDAGIGFIPLAVETIGGWGRAASDFLSSVGRLQSSRLGLDRSETIKHLFQKLSVSLWRGNATMWLSRLTIPHSSIDGVI